MEAALRVRRGTVNKQNSQRILPARGCVAGRSSLQSCEVGISFRSHNQPRYIAPGVAMHFPSQPTPSRGGANSKEDYQERFLLSVHYETDSTSRALVPHN